MTRILSWLRALGEGGYFGGGLPVHDHSNSGSGGTGVIGTRTAGTPCVQNPYVVGSVTTTAHGLGVEPVEIHTVLECLTADLGYAVGDKVDLGATISQVGGGLGPTILGTATNTIVSTQAGAAMQIARKDTGANGVITPANWKITATSYKGN